MLTQVKKPLRQLGKHFANKDVDQNRHLGGVICEETMQSSDSVRPDGSNAAGIDSLDATAAAAAADSILDADVVRRSPMKFAYPSGSQPLAGYTIKRGVGFGGFGDVYYATSDAGKEVALKRIQRNLDVELRGVRQCLNLKHPNLVALYDIRHDDEGQAWVVMEYVAGDSLQEVIERNPNGMPIDQVANWFTGISEGVTYLHDHGIVHRDLKPGNIFVDGSLVKIGDYGLAKFISCSRRSGQTESVGTFHYMAPEIGLGRYGKEIDIYAMGILLFEMLTGKVPFDGESSQEIIMKHLTAEPDLSMLAQPYQRVIAKALNKDPDKRYRSVSDMSRDLGLSDLVTGGRNERPVLAQVVAPQTVMPEEPIAKAVKELAANVRAKWQSSDLNLASKIILVVCCLILFTATGAPVLSLAFAGGIIYAGYFVVWYLVNSAAITNAKPKPSSAVQSAVQPAAPKKVRRVRRQKPITKQQIADELRRSMQQQCFTQQVRDLTGSMLMAALVSAVLCVLLMLIGIRHMDTAVHSWGPNYAWLTISSVIGAWSILFLSKLWETRSGDQALRRFFMLAAGLGVGAVSFFVAQGLLLEPSYVLTGLDGPFQTDEIPVLYSAEGTPQLLAFMGYFGALFGCLRMWLNADPLRPSRLRFFSTLFVIGAGILLHTILPIPKGFLIAGTTAIAVQLASPWVDSDRRVRAKKDLEQRQLEAIG